MASNSTTTTKSNSNHMTLDLTHATATSYAAATPSHATTPSHQRPFSSYPANATFNLHSLSLPPLFKRLLKYKQMDFEYAAWTMWWLIVSPKKVYRNIYYHKGTSTVKQHKYHYC